LLGYPSSEGPGKTKKFPTLAKAKEEAKNASMKADGFVTVMVKGIETTAFRKGKEKKK